MVILEGQLAPPFTLFDQEGKKHSLSQYKGAYVLLYFYPRNNTPGCTKEACNIRDAWSDFQKANIKVLGVSTDSAKSHEKFANKHALPFTLLADVKKEVVDLYGVLGKKKFFGKEFTLTHRMSFLIDPDGKISKVYKKVKPNKHAQEVLDDVVALKNV